MFRIKILLLLFLFPALLVAQNGGIGTYKFLDMPNAARVAALGGNLVSIADGDLDLSYHNPALLDSLCDNNMALNYISYYSGIKYGYAAYSKHINKIGSFAVGIHYVDYGDFIRANEYGEKNGSFDAAEYAINLTYSRVLIDSMLQVGATLKPIISNLENYSSYGLACDFGLYYNNPRYLLGAAVVVKNVGSQIKPYYESNYEELPFDIQMGVSKRLQHAPFRFSLTLQHLYQWDLLYDTDDASTITDSENKKQSSIEKFGDNLWRHTVLGVEFLPGKNFHLRAGFNPKRRKEMAIEGNRGFVGFSWGFGIKISKFHVSYARSAYHIVGSPNYFSISTNLTELSQMKVFNKKNENEQTY